MHLMRKSFFYSLLFLIIVPINGAYSFMSGVSPEKDGGLDLHIVDGKILQGPPNIVINAGYGIFKNMTDEDIKLIRLTSPVFDEVQLHDMEYSSDGKAKMVEIKEPIIPAKGVLELQHGGKHLMLINRRRDLNAGEIIKIMVESNKQKRYMLELKVIDPRHQNTDNSHHGHHEMHSH